MIKIEKIDDISKVISKALGIEIDLISIKVDEETFIKLYLLPSSETPLPILHNINNKLAGFKMKNILISSTGK